ncbi:EF-hand domain-containing protein, partial [archaeon]
MSTSSQALYELETLFIQKLQEKYKLNLRDLKKAFSRFDLDQNGLIDLNEMVQGVQLFLNGVKRGQVEELVSRYDVNGDGKISYEEFLAFLTSRTAISQDDEDEEAEEYDQGYGDDAGYEGYGEYDDMYDD